MGISSAPAIGLRSWSHIRLGCLFMFLLYPLGGGLAGFLVLLLTEAFAGRVRRREAALTPEPTYRWFQMLLCFAAVSSLVAYQPGKSLLVTLGMALLIWGGLAIGRSLALDDDFCRRWALPTVTVGVVASALMTLAYLGSHPGARAHTVWTTENGTGTVLVLGTGLAIGYLLSLKSRWRWPLLIGVTGLSAAALVATLSRGGWLGFAAMLLVLTRHSKRMIVVLLLAVLLLSLAAGRSPGVQERIGRVFSLEKNLDRVEIWKTALTMVKERPVFGVGPGLFSDNYLAYRRTTHWGGVPAYAHNLFLQVAAESGIIGLVVFVAIIGRTALLLFRLANRMGPAYWGLEAVFWGTLVHQQVDIPIWGAAVGSGWWVLVGFAVASYGRLGARVSLSGRTGASCPGR